MKENKRSEKKSRKKEKNGAVVVGVEESKENGQKSNGHNVKNGDQTFANEGFQADENDRRSDSSPRVVENGDSAGLNVNDAAVEANGRTDPDGSHTVGENSVPDGR